MLNEIKFTIVIPTRERADTLAHTLANVVLQDYGNFQILVSDNASDDDTREVVQSFTRTHNNIRYINTNQRLSMSHNWEFALSHIDDGWVIFLGDDDGLLPGALAYVDNIVKQTGVHAVASSACGFSWPNDATNEAGRLTCILDDGFRLIDSRDALQNVIDGEKSYSHLPMLYQGFIDSVLIRKAKSVTTNFFLSMIPDVYAAIALTLLTTKYAYSRRPLVLTGHSHHSGGAAAFSKTERNKEYNPALAFFRESNIPFHENLPPLSDGTVVRSIQAIVYESYLQAVSLHHNKDIRTSPEQQLFVILRDASPDFAESIGEWSQAFADLHHIDWTHVRHRLNSVYTKIHQLVRRMKGYSFYARRIVTITSESSLPMRTVYEAGIVAATLIKARPGLAFRVGHLLQKTRRRFLSFN